MRIKKSILKKISSSSRRKPAPDLDPTSNLDLHEEIWLKLKAKIATDFLEREFDAIPEPSGIPLASGETPDYRSHERIFGQDVRRLVRLVSRAILNPSEFVHTSEELLTYVGQKDRDLHGFPNPQLGSFSEPLTLVDTKGRIVLWHLPGLLSCLHQLDVRTATQSIWRLLRESVQNPKEKSPAPNWRVHRNQFINGNAGQTCEPGAINFSAGWFGQGHEHEPFPLLPSLNIRERPHLGQSDWLKTSNNFERILNLTLSLIHPELFKCGLEILEYLRQSQDSMEIAKQWQSVYTGIAIISNRVTPSHRDKRGKPEWFDLLMNYAGADSQPRLLIHDLGLELEYSSGTVVGLCGKIFEHEVRAWGDGDRVCYAHFMREAVRKRVGAQDPSWVDRSIYLPDQL